MGPAWRNSCLCDAVGGASRTWSRRKAAGIPPLCSTSRVASPSSREKNYNSAFPAPIGGNLGSAAPHWARSISCRSVRNPRAPASAPWSPDYRLAPAGSVDYGLEKRAFLVRHSDAGPSVSLFFALDPAPNHLNDDSGLPFEGGLSVRLECLKGAAQPLSCRCPRVMTTVA